MPIYCYRATENSEGCDHCKNTFEIKQKMSEDALKTCPECGGEIERIIAPYGVYFYTDRQKQMLSDKNLSRMGFTKLVREGKGVYRKTTTTPDKAY
ncbi:MAG: zinc ribbon domain-containing protein [bacterium]|nr:zinc ribbon domain-containing protein [bacterium]